MECPTCLESFETDRAMKIHHSMSHGESIAIDLVDCDNCGDSFERKTSHVRDNNFCSHGCYGEWLSENKTGEESYCWNGGMLEVECDNCGECLERKKCLSETKHFCNQKCQGEWRSENLTGEDAWAYKDGSSLNKYYNTVEWKEFRKKMVDELSTDCKICGDSSGRQNALHHIIRLGDFDETSDGNFKENVVFLCHSHHMELENLSTEEQIERLNSVPHVPNTVSKLSNEQ